MKLCKYNIFYKNVKIRMCGKRAKHSDFASLPIYLCSECFNDYMDEIEATEALQAIIKNLRNPRS
jgi:hypothetical protein